MENLELKKTANEIRKGIIERIDPSISLPVVPVA